MRARARGEQERLPPAPPARQWPAALGGGVVGAAGLAGLLSGEHVLPGSETREGVAGTDRRAMGNNQHMTYAVPASPDETL